LLFSYDKKRIFDKYQCSFDQEKSALKMFRSLSAEDMKEGMAECLYEFYKTLRYSSNDFILKNTNLLIERIVHDIDSMEKSEKQSERECVIKVLQNIDVCVKALLGRSLGNKT
jgi:predicted AAA+ superfamily ATPase